MGGGAPLNSSSSCRFSVGARNTDPVQGPSRVGRNLAQDLDQPLHDLPGKGRLEKPCTVMNPQFELRTRDYRESQRVVGAAVSMHRVQRQAVGVGRWPLHRMLENS